MYSPCTHALFLRSVNGPLPRIASGSIPYWPPEDLKNDSLHGMNTLCAVCAGNDSSGAVRVTISVRELGAETPTSSHSPSPL